MMPSHVRTRDDDPTTGPSYKDEFLASLSHELRTPLQAILGYATALREGEASEETRRGLAVIERNARSLTQLVERLLDLSLLRAGRVRPSFERADLADLARASVAALAPLLASRQIHVALQTAGETHADVDATYLRKAIDQLIFNGLRASKDGATLVVDIEGGDVIAVRVTDTGSSWTRDTLTHAFDLFAPDLRAERSSDGLGIGLAFIKSVAELHHGETFAYLAPEGQTGATFGFGIVAASRKTRSDRRTSAPPSSTEEPLGPGTVLVVEDEEDARDLLRLILERQGLRVVAAEAAHEALAHLATERFDFMVSDIGLPGMSGLDLIRTIRAGSFQPDLRAVALTAFAGPHDGTRAIDAGYDRFLPKPADARAVVSTLRELARMATPEGRHVHAQER